MSKKAIIIGAGPAGLTAAYELLKRTDIKPIILEKSSDIGGISKTINYKGNRMDIGGHRFFSKSDRVMKWWMNIMPIQQTDESYTTITYQRKYKTIKQEETHAKIAASDDKKVMLIRQRLSRIYFLRKFFTYPIQLSLDTLQKLGFIRTFKILLSYLYAQIVPRKPEKSLEDFMINRFGRQLYLLFFKDYTEKVWGVACDEISAEWGAQRIKGISISKAIQHAAKSLVQKKNGSADIAQKGTETSLIEKFLYPALGPGQLWEEVARQIEVLGGTIIMNQDVKEINVSEGKVSSVVTTNSVTGEKVEYQGDYFFSTMPVQELIAGMNGSVPNEVKDVAAGLQYRDFITVGVLLKKLSTIDVESGEHKTIDLKDTWIYIQEKDVKVGRLQLFNNWSPYMVNKPGTVWVGMEYFCNKGDDFWSLSDEEIKRTAITELEKMGLAQVTDVLDSTAHRVEKTYPAYFGTYDQFDKIRAFVDGFENLFLVGRNGMHKYNNSDHSMLTAMVGVDNICEGIASKENIWAINTEQEYHEEKNSQQLESMTQHRLQSANFKSYLSEHKKVLIWSGVLILLQLIAFKYLYPFASFINGDSYAYLEAAANNLTINTYPVGYSNFLRILSAFSKSDTLLVAFQYILLQVSILGLLFTMFFLYEPHRLLKIVLIAFFVLNPVFLYLANYVSSDSLFLSLSLIWLTLLLWIINKPTTKLLVIHAIVLLIAFTVRYNALYYPIVAIIAFALSKQRLFYKVSGALLSVGLIIGFIFYTSNEYKKLTGIRQFSPFSGWQLANNAMYAYKFIAPSQRKKAPDRFLELDKMVTDYFDSTRNNPRHPSETLIANTVYMWVDGTPLRDYKKKHFPDSSTGYLRSWATFGPFYADYGSYLIKKYPFQYLQYYIVPNSIRYFSPPVEFLEHYSTGRDSVHRSAQIWFGYKSNKIYTRVGSFNVKILGFLPILAGAVNMMFLFGFIGFLILNGYRAQPKLKSTIWIFIVLWVFNFCFSILASPTTLRFQLFNILITVTIASFFIEYIIKVTIEQSIETKRAEKYHPTVNLINNQ
jgi:protoporphyrinogen oxidase